MRLSFQKIIASILCISFISGATLVLANSSLKNKVSEYTQTSDKSDASEEMQDKKIDYFVNQSLTYFNVIQDEYEMYSAKNSICFLSYPPFSPPKA